MLSRQHFPSLPIPPNHSFPTYHHPFPTNPSHFPIDISGRVRVWAWTNEGHTLKYECQALGGEVEDVAWDGESKRILAVGGGATNAKVFAWDTGSNLAEIVPHSKKVITCDVRPTKPTKLAYGGEDFKMSFYAGPPFKFAAALKEHSNFVNCVRYSPDGLRFASFSADKSCIIYDGETAAVLGKLEAVHGGGVYAGAWSPDGTKIATACGDKAVRVFDMSSPTGPWTVEATFICGTRPDDMQNNNTRTTCTTRCVWRVRTSTTTAARISCTCNSSCCV